MTKKIVMVVFMLVLVVCSQSVFAAKLNDIVQTQDPEWNTFETTGGTSNNESKEETKKEETKKEETKKEETKKEESLTTGDWWLDAFNFLTGYEGEDTTIGNNTVGGIIGFLDPVVNLVKVLGNMIFVAVTVILGVKYIWGSVESKANVKDSLATLVIAALVFYGWNTISALFMNGNELTFIKGSADLTAKSIYSLIMYVCNFLAIGGIVYIGVKYMLAGAEGKSQIKMQGVPLVLGIIMVYATITFLNFIVGIL